MAPAASTSAVDLTSEILHALSDKDPVLSAETFPQVPFGSIKAALDRLASRSMVTYEQVEREEATLEPEAEVIVSHGSHEARVFEAVREALDGLSIQDLESKVGDKTVTKVGQGKAFKEKWIKKDGNRLVALVSYSEALCSASFALIACQVDSINDVTRDQLRVIQETRTHDPKILADLKKRKLLKMQKVISFTISKGPKYALEMIKEETDLTAETLASGSWKTATFSELTPHRFSRYTGIVLA
jgi:phenylalanyl-tRNA synthetase alpha chain